MRKIKRFIIGLAAVILGLTATSCAKEDNILHYNNATMGNIVNGKFVSDQGNIFNITSQNCSGDITKLERAFVICDVIRKVEGTENEYDVELNYLATVLDKPAVPSSNIQDLETYMNDPLVLHDIWFSGGYLNVYISVPVKRTGGQTHEINLLYGKEEGIYKFNLRHDAKGEVLKGTAEDNDLAIAYAYASFPVSELISEETAMVDISLQQYLVSGSQYLPHSSLFNFRKEYKKGGFLQENTY